MVPPSRTGVPQRLPPETSPGVPGATGALPDGVRRLADALVGSSGVVALMLGGSRAGSGADALSDWDLAVYYRGDVDLRPLAAFGDVHRPGAWGRLMNGGAWLTVEGTTVDVLLRDLEVVEHWMAEANRGGYEVDALLGYVAGLPTYSLMAERACGRLLAGTLAPVGAMPPALVASAPPRWRFARDFSLEYARMHAARGNHIGAVGQAARAAFEEAHARLSERGQWVLNEKRMLDAAGLGALQARFAAPAADAGGLAPWLQTIAEALS